MCAVMVFVPYTLVASHPLPQGFTFQTKGLPKNRKCMWSRTAFSGHLELECP